VVPVIIAGRATKKHDLFILESGLPPLVNRAA